MKDEAPKTTEKINPRTSPSFTGLQVTDPKDRAGGIPAVRSALQHGFEEMGLVKTIKTLAKLNQSGGFDCPGCAWPDPKTGKRSRIGEYCENGAKAVAEEGTRKRIGADFFARYSVAELSQWSDYELGKSGRLVEPLILEPGQKHYRPLSWEAAFAKIAENLRALHSPDEAIFYTSGRASNEAAFSYQLFARDLGTNNLPDCSNMCHESSGAALSQTLGIGKGSVTLEDFYRTDLVIVVGQNPGTNHPRMLSALAKAKQGGAKIISINPLQEAGLHTFVDPQSPSSLLSGGQRLSDLYLQVQVNRDLALFKAILLLLWEREKAAPGTVFDQEFIRTQTAGYADFTASLADYSVDELIAATGLSRASVEASVELIATRKKIIICWAMGVTQHRNAVQTIREIVNLLLLKGSVGIPGGGTCPVRGHSNVQGDRTVGIWEKPPAFLLEGIRRRFGFVAPSAHGYDVVASIRAMHEGRARVFMALGGNFLSATPDTLFTARALQSCELTVQVSTKLNRSHLVHGRTALMLPCKVRSEQDVHSGKVQLVSVENSMGQVHTSRGLNLPAAPNLLSEVQIICRLAEATLPDSSVDYAVMARDYDRIREHIEAIIPGFEDYNRRVRQPDGFYLPNGARNRQWTTTNRKANFTVNEQLSPVREALAADELLMMTLRSHDQYNTTIYGLHDRYRGIYNERRVVLMNGRDMARLELKAGTVVDLTSTYDGELRREPRFIVVKYDIPRGCVATYFPEANSLVPIDSIADISRTPTSKSVRVRIVPAQSSTMMN
ncbi:MAG: FdhF/YdeP family oxidoreductase [Bacteroidota bacterium]